jgi:hypothetical protein
MKKDFLRGVIIGLIVLVAVVPCYIQNRSLRNEIEIIKANQAGPDGTTRHLSVSTANPDPAAQKLEAQLNALQQKFEQDKRDILRKYDEARGNYRP